MALIQKEKMPNPRPRGDADARHALPSGGSFCRVFTRR
jgi:hypothetical protein